MSKNTPRPWRFQGDGECAQTGEEFGTIIAANNVIVAENVYRTDADVIIVQQEAGYSNGYATALETAAQLCDEQADRCQPGSPAVAQNWPLCLIQMGRRIRALATSPKPRRHRAWRKATPAENMEVLFARLNDQMSPAERREIQEVISILKSASEQTNAAPSDEKHTYPAPQISTATVSTGPSQEGLGQGDAAVAGPVNRSFNELAEENCLADRDMLRVRTEVLDALRERFGAVDSGISGGQCDFWIKRGDVEYKLTCRVFKKPS